MRAKSRCRCAGSIIRSSAILTVEWYWRRVTYPARMASTGARLLIENPVGMLEVYIDGKAAGAYLRQWLDQAIAAARSRRLAAFAGLAPRSFGAARGDSRGASCGLGPVPGAASAGAHRVPVALPDAGGNTLLVHYCLEAEEPFTGALHLQILIADRREFTQQTVALDMTGAGIGRERSLSLGRCPRWSPEDATGLHLARHAALHRRHRRYVRKALRRSICKFAHGKFYIDGQPVLLKGMRFPGGFPCSPLRWSKRWNMS